MHVLKPQFDPAIDIAPLPTAKTLRQRRNLAYQFVRFLGINLKMIRVIVSGHH
ncbi:MAG: hypothetical protein LBE83_00155 [Propionibacteriaceae bacterium]|nr:hypothetical protein [Propionibacteriaceae bacterium]